MRELVDADSTGLPIASTGGYAPQQSEIVSRGNRGTRSEERRNAPTAHPSKQNCRRWRSRGVEGVPHPTRRKNDGKNLGEKLLERSEKRGEFARKKRRGKRAERRSARKKHKAVRARSRLEELTFGTLRFAQPRSTASTVSATSTPY